MKTQKFLLALIIILGFAFNNTMAQDQKKQFGEYPEYWDNIYYPCVGEILAGWVSIQHWSWGSRHLVKADGILVGKISGKEYSLSNNWDYIEFVPLSSNPQKYKLVLTLMLRDGNKLVAKIHQTFLGYYNENGDFVRTVENENVDCK